MADKLVVELKHPITIPGEGGKADTEIASLTFGRLKAKHMKHLPDELFSGNADARTNPTVLLPLIGSLCGLTEEQAGEIDLEDLIEVAGKLMDFIETSLPKSTEVGGT